MIGQGNLMAGGLKFSKAIHQKKPDFMVWLGDNIYLREPDWSSHSGYLSTLHSL